MTEKEGIRGHHAKGQPVQKQVVFQQGALTS